MTGEVVEALAVCPKNCSVNFGEIPTNARMRLTVSGESKCAEDNYCDFTVG